ncbi:MAG: manganese catalase [Thermoleophilia bacterium]|nr:manganese catalase [Thermoleophilia bacterium]MCZ4495448.1 manganese catalase [Thermoleophilia bacterium]
MILRIDRWLTELPPPSEPDPEGANIVQELMGGKFGEMSTFLNYTFQSFNFRDRQKARPFFDLISNIAAEEFGHIELVAATINSMLTDDASIADKVDPANSPLLALAGMAGMNPHHFVNGGRGALPQDSRGIPWTGDNVVSTGDLLFDLTHNYFLETGARSGKLRVYEAVDHPAARALTGYLLVRGGVHQLAYARAVENLTGTDLSKLFPGPRVPSMSIKESRPYIERGDHRRLYRFSPDDYRELAAVFNGNHPETGEPLEVVDEDPSVRPIPTDLPSQNDVFSPGYSTEEIKEIADQLRKKAGLPDQPIGDVTPVPRTPAAKRRARPKPNSARAKASMPTKAALRPAETAQARSDAKTAKPAARKAGTKPAAQTSPKPAGTRKKATDATGGGAVKARAKRPSKE